MVCELSASLQALPEHASAVAAAAAVGTTATTAATLLLPSPSFSRGGVTP